MNKNKFLYFEKVPAAPSSAGERYKPDCKLVRDGDTMSLVEVGKIDVQEYISSFEDGVSLPRMIARFQAGDTSVFSGDSGFYGDVSQMPRSLEDAISRSRANYQLMQETVAKVLAEKKKTVLEENKESEVSDNV